MNARVGQHLSLDGLKLTTGLSNVLDLKVWLLLVVER